MISRLQESGWAGRIPLPDRLSVGAVLNKETARKLGNTPEERLEAAIDQNPDLGMKGKNRKRPNAEVPTYTNYQLISDRGSGSGWVAVGDAYGFIDPMLSPGLFIAMWSAQLIADIVPVDPPKGGGVRDREFREYGKQMRHMLQSWRNLITTFYDGAIFSVYKAGTEMRDEYGGWISNKIERHIEKRIAGMACGAFTDKAYSQHLVRKMTRYGLREHDPKLLAIS